MLAFAPSFLFSAFMVSAGFALEKTQVWHPKTLDLYLFSFDASLHVQLAFLVGQAFAVLPWFRAIGMALYIALPIPMAMVYAGQLLRGREKAFPAMAAFLLTGQLVCCSTTCFLHLGPRAFSCRIFPGIQ
jgi:hypothetical protein